MSAIQMAGQKKLVLISGRAYPELAERVAEELGAELVPTDVVELVWAREAEIRSGARKVAIDDSEPKSTN